MKRYALKIFKVEVVEVEGMVEVVKAAEMKDIIRRKDSRVKQFGVEEDVVEEEAVNQKFSYKCQKYGHYANDCSSEKCYNCGRVGHKLQKIVELEKGWKEQPT